MSSRIIFRQKATRSMMQTLEQPKVEETHILKHSVIQLKFSEGFLNKVSKFAEALYTIADIKREWGLLGSEYQPSTPESRMAGILGQMAVAQYIWSDWREAVQTITIGEPDAYDIKYKNWRIDVKTFNWLNKKDRIPDSWMFILQRQFRKRHYDYYIACQRIAEDTINILGFMSRQAVEQHGVPFLDYPGEPIGIDKLELFTPMKELKCKSNPELKKLGGEQWHLT